MRSIWTSRLGKASIALAIAGLAVAAGGASAEARDYVYWNGYGYQHYYGPPAWGHRWHHYSYYNTPRSYYAPRTYAYTAEPRYYRSW